jgi:hypothetical protein
MPLRWPDPGTFEHLLEEFRMPADSLVRLSIFPGTEPYWSRGRYRFDGPPADNPESFGTCYAAQKLEVAFAESIIHENAWFLKDQFQVPQTDLDARHVIELVRPAKPDLILADFTGLALKKLGLNNDISSGDDYTLPMAWAKGGASG